MFCPPNNFNGSLPHKNSKRTKKGLTLQNAPLRKLKKRIEKRVHTGSQQGMGQYKALHEVTGLSNGYMTPQVA